MQIDKNSQIRLIDLISQTQITSIDDFPVDLEPNRIKEKKESLKNTLDNRFNIPMSSKYILKSKIEDKDLSYNVINVDFSNIVDGGKKPINVKDVMLEKIRENSSKESSVEKDKSDVKVDSNSTVGENKNDILNKVVEEKINVDDKELEKLIDEVSSFKEQIEVKMQKIKKEKEEIENLNKEMEDLSLQYEEVEQKLENAKFRKLELQNQLISKLNSQIDSLNNELVDVSKLSDEVNKKKNDSNNRVVEFKKKIAMTQEEIDKVNAEIDKKEQILTLFDKKMINDSNFDNEDENKEIRKIA